MPLINRNSLLKKFESGALLFQPDIRKIIEEEPEAVIKCKDCRFYDSSNSLCENGIEGSNFCNENDFCSFADSRWI